MFAFNIKNLHIICTTTKSIVIERRYLLITSGSTINMTTFSSSTNIPQFGSRHTIDWFKPSSTIFWVRYWPQQPLQNLWPHSKLYISWNVIKRQKNVFFCLKCSTQWSKRNQVSIMSHLHPLYHSIFCNRLNRCRHHLPKAMMCMDSLPLLF